MKNPILSIIIPCYNSESTLEETLVSVFNQDLQEWEAIIINDGSPDNLENIALSWVKKDSRFKYFKKENGGLGSARNFGINKANGEYILPLDSDNIIRKSFTKDVINILKIRNNIGVVYTDLMLFGDREEILTVGKFDKYKLLVDNYIDACAVIRKTLFVELGLYDENLPYQGHEDWEFWLRVLSSDYKFFYLQKVCFDYRVSSNSMLRTFNKDMKDKNVEYIISKHYQLYRKAINELLTESKLKNKFKTLFSKITEVLKKA